MANPAGPRKGATIADGQRRDHVPVIALALAVVWSLWLYTPWNQAYLDRADFNEFLPFLKSGRNFLEGFELMSGYYWSQGRFLPLTIAFTAAKWSAFETWAPGWQWTTYALMLTNVVMLYRVARRFGASTAGSAVASALMIVGTSAVESWCRVHFSEGEGTFFFLSSVYFASDLRRHPSAPKAWGAAGLLACAILTKETFAAVIPFVLLVELCYNGEGEWGRPSRGGREFRSAAIAALVSVLAVIPAVAARVTSPPHSYGVRYGPLRVIPAVLAGQVHNIFLPTGSRLHEPLADIVILAIVLAGWLIAARGRTTKRGMLIGVLVLLSLPLAGFLIYLPWPQWAPFYALPFSLALAVFLALGLTFLWESAGVAVKIVVALALFVAAVDLSASAAHQSSEIYARRRVVGESVAALSDYVSRNMVTEIIVPEDIRGTATSLQRYANATRPVEFPPFRPAGCDDNTSTSRPDSDALVLRFSYLCRNRPVAVSDEVHSVRSAYRWLEFPQMKVHSDEYSAAFFRAPSSADTSVPK